MNNISVFISEEGCLFILQCSVFVVQFKWCASCIVEAMNSAAVALSDQLENRLIEFGVSVVKLAQALPKTPECRHFRLQILRCGTAAAPNYAEARGAESRADFIHKMGIVQKELNETSVWLRMLERIVAEKSENISAIVAENRELARIVTASIKTAQSRLRTLNNEH